MKVFSILALGIFSLIAYSDSKLSKKSSQSKVENFAINEILRNHLTKSFRQVEIIRFGSKGGDKSEEILKSNEDQSVSLVSKLDPQSAVGHNLDSSSLLIFDSVENFHENRRTISWNHFSPTHRQHLVYAPGLSIEDVMKIEDGDSIDNVNFLVRNGSQLELVTSFMYTEEKCRSPQFRTINIFDEKSMKWEKSEFYPEKYRNFHGCVFRWKIGNYLDQMAYGFIQMFRKNINFKPYGIFPDEEDEDVTIGVKTTFDQNVTFVGIPQNEIRLVIIIPPGLPYSDFEKLFLAFDDGAWIAIGLTFAFVFSALCIVGKLPKKIRNFILGRWVRTPTVNFISTFLAGYQQSLPDRNFARFMVMLFIIWSLIIRTCYQSKLFEVLQADVRKPAAKTLDELYEQNFTYGKAVLLFKTNQALDNFANATVARFPKQIFEFIFFNTIWLDVVEPENKLFTIVEEDVFKYMDRGFYRSGTHSLLTSTDVELTYLSGIEFDPYRPFVRSFQRKIMQCFEGGLRLPKGIAKVRVKETIDEVGPQILTLEHLRAGFVVYLFASALSFVVFLVELVVKRVSD